MLNIIIGLTWDHSVAMRLEQLVNIMAGMSDKSGDQRRIVYDKVSANGYIWIPRKGKNESGLIVF